MIVMRILVFLSLIVLADNLSAQSSGKLEVIYDSDSTLYKSIHLVYFNVEESVYKTLSSCGYCVDYHAYKILPNTDIVAIMEGMDHKVTYAKYKKDKSGDYRYNGRESIHVNGWSYAVSPASLVDKDKAAANPRQPFTYEIKEDDVVIYTNTETGKRHKWEAKHE